MSYAHPRWGPGLGNGREQKEHGTSTQGAYSLETGTKPNMKCRVKESRAVCDETPGLRDLGDSGRLPTGPQGQKTVSWEQKEVWHEWSGRQGSFHREGTAWGGTRFQRVKVPWLGCREVEGHRARGDLEGWAAAPSGSSFPRGHRKEWGLEGKKSLKDLPGKWYDFM